MAKSSSEQLIEAIAVTAELTGTALSKGAAIVMAQELAQYPGADVEQALNRCRRELTGHLSLAAILQRLPNGHPGPEEAWAMVAHLLNDERATAVLTGPMRKAFFAVDGQGMDKISARMAFLEVYRREVGDAEPPEWGVILGWDPLLRADALSKAVEQGKLTAQEALPLLPSGAHKERDAIEAQFPAMQALR